jgi:hypothetical protein
VSDLTELWRRIDQDNHEELAQRLKHTPGHAQSIADRVPAFWSNLVKHLHEDVKKLNDKSPDKGHHWLVYLSDKGDICMAGPAYLDCVVREPHI